MKEDEELIELVKNYPVLYNMSSSQYRDKTIRTNAWEEIAEKMNTNTEELKDKWGKLRNCFTNAMKRRRKKSGQAATKVVPWKYEKQMEFLIPHLNTRSTVTNLSNDDYDPTQELELIFSEEHTHSPPSTICSPTPRTSSSSASTITESTQKKSGSSLRNKTNNDNENYLLKEMVKVIKSTHDIRQKRASEMDENDHFFLSMSKQLKKLPSSDQAEIKFQIHKLIHDSELKMLNNGQGQGQGSSK